MPVKILLQSFWLVLLMSAHAVAYEAPVHKRMSEHAYDQSVLSPTNGDYLATLGLTNEQLISGLTARRWVRDGSALEDDECCLRYLNHFYDPTTGNGLLNLPDFIATDAINWALERDTGTLTQNWSIPDARNYFYRGLTDLDPNVREENLAKTFRALGQVIHLIQDMAQPQHVRIELHLETGFAPLDHDRSRYELYTGDSDNIANLAYTGYSSVDFSDYISYWDASNGSGLAEITNQHFFTEQPLMDCAGFDTCIEVRNDVVYNEPVVRPSERVDEQVTLTLKDETTVTGIMTFFPHTFVDPITNETVTNPRVLTFSLFDIDLEEILEAPIFSQNQFTFKESQKILIKRAVGYSAGLINYFFRGALGVEATALYDAQGQLDGLELAVRNATTEPVGAGTLLVAYQFQAAGATEVTYGVSEAVPVSQLPAPGEASDPYTFSLTPPIPPNVAAFSLRLIFRGQLGAEADAVIAQRFTLQPYIFIIQDRLTPTGQVTESSRSYDRRLVETYNIGETYTDLYGVERTCRQLSTYQTENCNISQHVALDSLSRRWDLSQQIMAGRFVVYGEISAIELQYLDTSDCETDSSLGCFTIQRPRLFINDQLMPEGTWHPGDTPTPPTTWRIEGLVSFAYVGDDEPSILFQSIVIQVTMSDQSDFSLSVAHVRNVAQGESISLCYDSSNNRNCRSPILGDRGYSSSSSAAVLFVKMGALITPDLFVGGSNLFEIVQMSGSGPMNQSESTSTYQRYGDPVTGNIYLETLSSRFFVGYDAFGNAQYVKRPLGILYEARGLETIEALYASLSSPAPVAFAIRGIFRRQYSTQEENILSALGIPTEPYDLILE